MRGNPNLLFSPLTVLAVAVLSCAVNTTGAAQEEAEVRGLNGGIASHASLRISRFAVVSGRVAESAQ